MLCWPHYRPRCLLLLKIHWKLHSQSSTYRRTNFVFVSILLLVFFFLSYFLKLFIIYAFPLCRLQYKIYQVQRLHWTQLIKMLIYDLNFVTVYKLRQICVTSSIQSCERDVTLRMNRDKLWQHQQTEHSVHKMYSIFTAWWQRNGNTRPTTTVEWLCRFQQYSYKMLRPARSWPNAWPLWNGR